VKPNVRLFGHYAVLKASTTYECFARCDADLKCAAACLIQPSGCLLYKYGFEETSRINGATAYIKPEVVAELALGADKLNYRFPIVHQATRLINHYDMFDTLTPSQCFDTCKQSWRCGAAAFSGDNKWLYNCQLYRSGQFKVGSYQEGDELWTSYIKSPKNTG
jgi:hypothetical protein